MMSKYRVSYVERKVIEVEAASPEEAEAKAFESDQWVTFVEDCTCDIVQTDDRAEIYDLFAKDDLEELIRQEMPRWGFNGISASDFDPDKNIIKSSN